jgi:hypothetical protein
MFLDDHYYNNYMNPHSYNRIKLINNNLNITYEMKYDVYDIHNIDSNYFDVNINNNININSIILVFDGPFNYNGLNIIQIKDFIIYFEENNLINLERFGHYFYIHFNGKTTYKFIIKYNNDKLSN